MAIFTAQCDVASLTQDNSVNGKLLGAFLDANQPTLPDAEKELRAGIVQAKRENKKMLVEVCSPGCGPCMEQSRYLTEHQELFSQDYVLVKLDSRMPHADDVTSRLGKKCNSVPWMAIVSHAGQTLMTSESEEGNIGFPRGDSQIEHFRTMLNTTRQRLSVADVNALIHELRR